MVARFPEQLLPRIQAVRPNPNLESYAIYVRVLRLKLGMSRAALAQRTGLEQGLLTFLENCLLLSDELTEDVREKIEKVLGIPYHTFRQLNGSLIEELRQDWGYSRFEKDAPDPVGQAGDTNTSDHSATNSMHGLGGTTFAGVISRRRPSLDKHQMALDLR